MALSGTLYASAAGSDENDGTTTALAKTLPGLITYVNTEGVGGPLELRLLTDGGTYTLTADLDVTASGAKNANVVVRGWSAASGAEDRAVIDGDTVANLHAWDVAAEFWHFRNITVQNLSLTSGSTASEDNVAWQFQPTAAGCSMIDCKVDGAYMGVNARNLTYPVFVARCELTNTRYKSLQSEIVAVDTVIHDFYGGGFYNIKSAIRCVAYNGLGNASIVDNDAFHRCLVCVGCVAYKIGIAGEAEGEGFLADNTGSSGSMFVDCIAVDCQEYAFGGGGVPAGMSLTLRCADYNCASRFGVAERSAWDIDGVTLTADPFVGAASGNFSLNDTAGGGAECRNTTGIAAPTATYSSYHAKGAAQPEDSGTGSTEGVRSSALRP